MSSHYKLTRRNGSFGFTSPIGNHFAHWDKREAARVMAEVLERHKDKALGGGPEAVMLWDYFTRDEPEDGPPVEPVPPPEPEPPKEPREPKEPTARTGIMAELHRARNRKLYRLRKGIPLDAPLSKCGRPRKY